MKIKQWFLYILVYVGVFSFVSPAFAQDEMPMEELYQEIQNLPAEEIENLPGLNEKFDFKQAAVKHIMSKVDDQMNFKIMDTAKKTRTVTYLSREGEKKVGGQTVVELSFLDVDSGEVLRGEVSFQGLTVAGFVLKAPMKEDLP